MCVTNTAFRRLQPIPVGQNSPNLCMNPSGQNMLSSFPLQQVSMPAAVATSLLATEARAYGSKPRPKRRRKPQKPGKTAKQNDRHFVVHNYHDHANDEDEHDLSVEEDHGHRGGVATAFPTKLHAVLGQVERDGLSHVLSWQPHGRCFLIHSPKLFVDYVMPKYFRQSKLTSFQRQLNLYGFARITRGEDAGGYYHELFLRGKEFLCKRMCRTKVKGTRYKAASSPDQEPDFYKMPFVVTTYKGSSSIVSNHTHSDEEVSFDSSARNDSLVPSSAITNSLYEPISIDYSNFTPVPAAAPQHYFPTQQPQQPVAPVNDSFLDQALNDLFFIDSNGGSEVSDFVNMFANTTAPSDADDFFLSEEDPIETDAELGALLDKLLEDV